MMTTHQKELARMVAERYGKLPPEKLFEELCRIGVVDHTRCKILAIRKWVDNLVRDGTGKVQAMSLAAAHFASTYENVRKCMYYYNDINI